MNVREKDSLLSPFFLLAKPQSHVAASVECKWSPMAAVLKGKWVVSKRKQAAVENHLEALKAWLN